MTPMLYVRTKVLSASQAELARIANTTQPTVSRWESGELEPGRDELERIRSAVLERGIEWDDAWFFDPPKRRKSA